MKKIAVITTGGTIAMSNGVPAESLKIAVEAEFFSFENLPSPFFTSDFAYRLSHYIDELSSSFDAIVITHGTDTMEESAFYLDLVFGSKIPLVFTGAIHMQSQSAYDGEANLQNAILVAKSVEGGVYILFDTDILPARYATKTNAVSRRAFSAPKSGRVGEVVNGEVTIFATVAERKTTVTPAVKGKIALIKSHYDIDSDLIKPLFENADAIVLEGFGGGRIPKSILETVVYYSKLKPVVITGGATEQTTGDEYLYEGGCAWAAREKLPIIYSKADSKKTAIALNLAIANGLDLIKYFKEEIF